MELNTKFSRLEASYSYLNSSIGQEVVILGCVKFESLRQTTQWAIEHLPSGEYHILQDSPTLLNSFSASHLSTQECIDENYQNFHDGYFNNASEASISAFFACELPPILVKWILLHRVYHHIPKKNLNFILIPPLMLHIF